MYFLRPNTFRSGEVLNSFSGVSAEQSISPSTGVSGHADRYLRTITVYRPTGDRTMVFGASSCADADLLQVLAERCCSGGTVAALNVVRSARRQFKIAGPTFCFFCFSFSTYWARAECLRGNARLLRVMPGPCRAPDMRIGTPFLQR